MNIKEFYNIIRHNSDPVEFENLKQTSTVEEKVIDRGTAYWLNIFEKHGRKDFFWSWNWAMLFFPTTFSFYRRIYILWVLKWACFFVGAPIIGLSGVSEESSWTIFIIAILLSRVFFASIANALYLRKVKQTYNKNKSNRLQPSTLAGFLGACLVPELL